MSCYDYQSFLDEYFSTALNIGTDLEHPNVEGSTQMQSSIYKPSCLLDLNWNDGDDDVFILNMFKKVFGSIQNHQSEYATPATQNNVGLFCSTSFLSTPPAPSNMVTEFVKVPTSKHVAQILGKKGSKIRALRETTNTYIRSPLAKEEPVFIVKGKKEDVAQAVEAIKSASDYFSSLEYEKEMTHSAAITQGEAITVKFSIPDLYVGLVVGVKGGTIKEIEKQTRTYIQSPTIDALPVFTITGSPENCEKAMNFISRYLALRGVGPGKVECVQEFEESSSGNDYFFVWMHTLDQESKDPANTY